MEEMILDDAQRLLSEATQAIGDVELLLRSEDDAGLTAARTKLVDAWNLVLDVKDVIYERG